MKRYEGRREGYAVIVTVDGRVIRINECAAVVIMNRPVRDFKTRFDKPVRLQPPDVPSI